MGAIVHLCLAKAFPELSWDFDRKINVRTVLTVLGQPATVRNATQSNGFSSDLVVYNMDLWICGTMTLQTVKVHIKVYSLQG